MRVLAMIAIVAAICLGGRHAWAQSSEIETPEVKIMLGVALVADEDDKLAVHFAAGAPVLNRVEMVTRTYTVMVPYTEAVERDGKMVPVTRTRAEERTREVPVTRAEVLNDFSCSWDELSFLDMDGDDVAIDDARQHFETKQPMVGIFKGSDLSPFYSHVLRDDVLVVVMPRPEDLNDAAAIPGVILPTPLPPRRR